MNRFIHTRIKTGKFWTTHIPLLIKTVQISEGPVLEIGGGPYSTPILHWLCKDMGRMLYTYENDIDYFRYCKTFQSKLHVVRFIEDWDKLKANRHWGVVFIDHHPCDQRAIDAIKFKDHADYVVIHDTDRDVKYGMDKVWPNFKYRYDWQLSKPYTSVVSNFKDLKEFKS